MNENISVPNGYFVTIFFKTAMSVSGVVLSWTSDYIIIKAQQGNNKIVIYNPKENILMIKINYDLTPSDQTVNNVNNDNDNDNDDDEDEENLDPQKNNMQKMAKAPILKKIKEIENQKKFLSSRFKETQPKNLFELNRYKNVVDEFTHKAK